MQKTRRRNRHTLFIISSLTIALLNFAIFWLYVNGKTIIDTFIVPEAFKEQGIFYNYIEVFKDVFLGRKEVYQGAFGHTMVAILINVIIFPIALITAYAFYKRVYGEKLFRVIFYLPSIIAITTLTMSFRELFWDNSVAGVTHTGPFALILKYFGVENPQLQFTPGMTSGFAYDTIWIWIIFFGVFTGLGTNVVLMCGAMMRIPKDVTEALRIDGCGFFKEMVRVSIPMIMPTITTWFIMIVTSVFGFSIMPMLMAGLDPAGSQAFGKINTIPLIIYANVTTNNASPELMAQMQSLGVIFSLIMMPFVLLVRWVCEKFTPDISY